MAEDKTENFSFVKAEHQILDFWNQNQIFQKSLEKTKSKKTYIFYDGPPFATGLPHFGHLVGSTLKDIIPRYFTMKGFHVERRFGWDCHGLPIEHEIDKKLGLSASDAVKKLGVKGYNDQCRSIVQRFTAEWEKTITRIGRWVDFKNDYKTMDLNFMESVWWVFKQLWDKNLIYQGSKVVPYSTALETVLSNFEAGQNYQDVQDPAITVLFKLKNEDTFIAAWTTTPWTLPSNLGLCMNADLDYVKIHDEESGKNIVLAKELLKNFEKKKKFKIISEYKGKDFFSKKYEPLFDYFKNLESEGAFQIFNDNYVTTDSGTGVVHLAPAFGEDDNRVFSQAHIKATVCPIDEAGRFTDEVTDFKGQYVKDADKNIIRFLKEKGLLYFHETIVHSYPFCWRSDTPLIYRTIPTWYVKVEELKNKLLASNSQINWIPEHIKDGRFGKWLEGARDWAISRNRVWGTPLPIWKNNKTGNFICMGSVKELQDKTGSHLKDLHRENVDSLEFQNKNEDGVYQRIPEVLDCWFESGSMPYAQLHYPFENKKIFEEGFPAEFIAEGLDQTRGWFYTLTVLSTALYEKPAFKNVIVNGIVNAEDGKKMSKRLKNYTEPETLMENYGADALRLYMINSGLVKAEELRFSDNGVKDMVRRAMLPWYNAFKFFKTYSEVDGFKPDQHLTFGNNITDRWILSKLQSLVKKVDTEMQNYRLYNVASSLFEFIEDLTNWFIRLNRRRYWEEGLSTDKKEAYSALYTSLINLSYLMAPIAPFLSETIYLQLKKENDAESVHLCDYPEFDKKQINTTLEDAVSRMQQVIELGRQKRNEVQIKVKTPLSQLTIIHKDKEILNEIKKLESLIQTELNVKKIGYSENEHNYIKLFAKPNSPVLGKRLGKDFKKFKQLIENLDTSSILKLETENQITLDGQTFKPEDIFVYREALNNSNALSNRLITIDLVCTLNDELLIEGLAREVVNRIQKYRKEKDFHVADRIRVEYSGDENLVKAVQTHKSYIASETLSLEIKENKSLNEGENFEIEGNMLKIALYKSE